MDEKTRQDYAQWLSSQEWTYFATFTFRGTYSPDGARRAASRFFKPFRTLELGVLFIESGRLYGKVHLHGLLRFDPIIRAGSIWAEWVDTYGAARVETIRSVTAVSNYVSKYITKSMKDETYFILPE